MKSKLLIGVVSCLMTLIYEPVRAENTDVSTLRHAIYIESLTVPQGTTEYTLSVKMKNEYEAKGFSFAIFLPEGFAFSTTDGIPDAQLSTVRTNSTHIDNFNANIQGDGALYVNANAQKGDGEIADNDGEVALIQILFPENAAAGDYTILVKNLSINLFNGEDAVTEEYGTQELIESTLTIDAGQFLDENNTDPNTIKPATDVKVTVKRTINSDAWSTICLPFAMTETQVKEAFGDNVQLGEFNGVDYEFDGDDVVGITVNFTNTQSIEANHPYIIKVSQPVSEFTLDGVDIVADEDEAYIEFDNGKTGSRRVVYSGFYGTYHAQTVLDKFTLFLSDNKFWYSMGQTTMKAFRAYFEFLDKLTDVENASNIKLWVNNDDEDGLQSLSGTPIMGENTYNLAGQRVGKNYKGIIIESGKKTIK